MSPRINISGQYSGASPVALAGISLAVAPIWGAHRRGGKERAIRQPYGRLGHSGQHQCRQRVCRLHGSTINGTLAFGPNGSGGGQFWPSTSITVPGQFRYSTTNTDTATFASDGTLTITDVVNRFASGWKMVFMDPSDPFRSLSLVSSNFAPALSYTVGAASEIVIDWGESASEHVTYTAVFDLTTGVGKSIPGPAGFAVIGLGLLSLGVLRHTR